MEFKRPYKNLSHAMKYLLLQVRESVPFCADWLPGNVSGPGDAEYLFTVLKSNTTFMPDPPKTELIQSAKTLLKNNYWGIAGAGDCDCFTVLVTACCIAAGIPCRIVLAGRDRGEAVHIYNIVQDENGFWKPFDLTNEFYGEARSYPYKQIIKLK